MTALWRARRAGLTGALALACCFLCARARAEPSPYLARENPLVALLPSADQQRARVRVRLEAQLSRALASAPDVSHASVTLTEPALADLPLDQIVAKPQLNVLLELRGKGPSDAEVARLLGPALPALASDQIHVLRASARAAPTARDGDSQPVRFTRVGPFLVARESSLALRSLLGVCLGANVLLAALLLARRRAQ